MSDALPGPMATGSGRRAAPSQPGRTSRGRARGSRPSVAGKSGAKTSGKQSGAGGPIRRLLTVLGPGLITGASDNDPSGIGTYSVAGASQGFGMLWLAWFTLPLVAAIQNICAR